MTGDKLGKCKAAFLDRDGVIIRDGGYPHRAEDLYFLPRAADALAQLASAGFLLIVVTNQSGIGRGLFTEVTFRAFTALLDARLASAGVRVTATLHCPHTPDAGCDCRKPLPGMLLAAAVRFDVNLTRSVMIGDKTSDLQAGRAAGVGRVCLIGPKGAGTEEAFDSLWDCAAALTST